MALDPLKLEHGRVGLEEPFGGGFGAQINGQEDAHGLPKIAANRVLQQRRAHCVHNPCGAFQRNGGLTGAVPADQFSGMPVNVAVVRSTIIVKASMRPGPHGCGVTEVRVAYSCTRTASLSTRLRNLSFASGARCSEPRRQAVEFCRIGQGRSKRVVEASTKPWKSTVFEMPPSIRMSLPLYLSCPWWQAAQVMPA